MRIYQVNFNLYCALKILVNSCQILRQKYEIFLLKESYLFESTFILFEYGSEKDEDKYT